MADIGGRSGARTYTTRRRHDGAARRRSGSAGPRDGIARGPPAGRALFVNSIEHAAKTLGLGLAVLAVNEAAELENTVREFSREVNGSLVVTPDALTVGNRERIIAAAARHRLPAAYPFRLFVTSG